jgi:hypothetical protein
MSVTGRQAKVAFGKFTTNSWGVAVAVSRGHYFNSTAGLRATPARVNDEAFGQAFLGRGDLGDHAALDLQWVGRSRYDDWSYQLDALAMGSPGAATISDSTSGQTTSYTHQLDLAVNNNGLGVTIAVDKSRFVHEIPSAKVIGFSEAVGDGGVIDKTFRFIGNKATNISSTNINSTVAGASFPALSNRVFRNQGIFRMNVQGGSGLAAGDAVKAETIELTFERPQDAPFVFGQDYVHTPDDNGWPVIRLAVTYPRMTQTSADSLEAAMRTNPVYKADLTYTGANINSIDTYKKLYQFPALELDEIVHDVEGPNQVKPRAVFSAKLAASSPTGMAFVNPMRLTYTNTNSLGAFQ